MIWMPTYITWNIWFGTNTSGPPDYTLTMTQGQACTYTQEFGGNQFAGTVNIPKSGKQQVIMNLCAQGQNVHAQATLIIRSLSYTHQIRSRT
jgi:hypothetical protein